MSGYAESFPGLSGSVVVMEKEAGFAAQVACLPGAACHLLLASLAGARLKGPTTWGTTAYVFRREAEPSLFRLKSFRQTEVVAVGPPDRVIDIAAQWRASCTAFWSSLGIDVEQTVASDPFVGRTARLKRELQLAGGAKTEFRWTSQIATEIALCSVNLHGGAFSHRFGFCLEGEEEAHSACIGFGLERGTLSLLFTHGLDIDAWPRPVRTHLLDDLEWAT